jgi:hypothetical protein
MVYEGCGVMKKNNILVAVAAGVVLTGASAMAIIKLAKKRKAKRNAAVASETKIISMDYKGYSTLEELYKEAKLIVKGQILGTETREIEVGSYSDGDSMNFLYTVSKVKVLKAIKGKVQEGDIIYVKQLGDGNKVIANGFDESKYFSSSQEYYLFLDSSDKDSKDSYEMPYSCLNPHQGSIRVEEDKIKSRDINVAMSDSSLVKTYSGDISVVDFEKEIEKYQ